MSQPTATTPPAASTRGATRPAPVVVQVEGLHKRFRIPEQKVDTLKERATHPLRRSAYRELHALRDVSFDVRRGEFFGIVGRNGSGKSTLLKILASIYRPDAGRVRAAGRVAPFIELGVGFNPELSARENCLLGGVLMGLSRREAIHRTDAIIEFGELGDFVDLKVKNYSSGMMVRLAFSIMVQADADIMLIDEVLAVGDAAFAQKCMDVFYDRRQRGRTMILVTHDMSAVHSLCHRAMALHEGEVQHVGDPEQTATHYYRLNFAEVTEATLEETSAPPERAAVRDLNARLLRARLTDRAGATVSNLEQAAPIRVDAELEAARELIDPIFVIQIRNAEGLVISGFSRQLNKRVSMGQCVRLRGEIENPLVPGSYTLECWIRRDREQGDMALQAVRLAQFVVYGTAPRHGMVSLHAELEPELETKP